MQDIHAYIPGIMLGASESVDVIAAKSAARYVGGFPGGDMLAIVDQRLSRRAILADPDTWIGDSDDSSAHLYRKTYKEFLDRLMKLQWEIRIIGGLATNDCIIVDGQVAVVSDPRVGLYRNVPTYYRIDRADIVKEIQTQFNRFWTEAENIGLLFEDMFLSSVPHVAEAIITVSEKRWGDLIAYLAEHPEQMRGLSPRSFEELVAELLVRDGMEVQLTQASKDGGRDILAMTSTEMGKHLYLVECKRYADENKVGVSIVRSLYGVVEFEKATKGIIVTTSDFTRGAIEFGKMVESRMDLKNYGSLSKWLRVYGRVG
jgi:restriction system protein